MTKCEQIWDDLKAYSDGELPIVARLRVRRHVSQCPACREEIEAMELIRRRMRQTDATAFTPELKDKILAGIPDGVPPTEDATPIRSKKKPIMIFGATAAAALCWFVFYPITQSKMQIASSKSAETSATAAMPMSKSAMPQEMAASKAANGKDVETASNMSADSYGQAAKGETESSVTFGASAAPAAPTMSDGIPEEITRRKFAGESKAKMPANSRPDDSLTYLSKQGTVDRQVHRDAALTVQVDSAEAKSEKVETSLKAEGGYVADSNLNTLDDGTKTATMTLKVPVDKFETFMATLSKLGEVKAKSVSGEDLTERISDEKQGKKVLGEEIEETQNRLSQRKTTKLQERDDRETLRELKTRIAVKQARLDLYKKMATLSNISLTLTEKPKIAPPTVQQSGFMSELKDTASSAGEAFMQAAKIPFVLLIWVVVYSPVWLILLAGYRYFVVRA